MFTGLFAVLTSEVTIMVKQGVLSLENDSILFPHLCSTSYVTWDMGDNPVYRIITLCYVVIILPSCSNT